jgi:hypothetical protein
MNIGFILRVAGTIFCGVAFVLTVVGGEAHAAVLCVTGGSTLIGVGTLV